MKWEITVGTCRLTLHPADPPLIVSPIQWLAIEMSKASQNCASSIKNLSAFMMMLRLEERLRSFATRQRNRRIEATEQGFSRPPCSLSLSHVSSFKKRSGLHQVVAGRFEQGMDVPANFISVLGVRFH